MTPTLKTPKSLTPAETASLVGLWEAAVRQTHDFLTEADILFYRDIVRRSLSQVDLYVLTDDSDTPIAFMGLSSEQTEMLFVRPDEQGKGYGRRLIEYACRKKGMKRVDVNEQNPGARAFYGRMGFRTIGRSETDDYGRPFPILHLEKEERNHSLLPNRT